MANEGRIGASLQIKNASGSLDFKAQIVAQTPDVAGSKGPVPGAITVSMAGTDIDFGELTTPALCHIRNLDPTNFVEYGIWDPEGNTFYPLGELLPAQSTVLRLSRNLQEEFGTGSGTTGPNTNRLRFKADTDSLSVLVEAFEV